MMKSLLLLLLVVATTMMHSIVVVAEQQQKPASFQSSTHYTSNIRSFLLQGSSSEFDDLEHLIDTNPDMDMKEFERHYYNESKQRNLQKVNIWQKLKESLGAAIVGFLLIIIAPCLIWKNEGRHVHELARIQFCKNKAVMVQCDSPTAETLGQMVHFVGNVSVGEDHPLTLTDDTTEEKQDQLNVTAPIPKALLLQRTVMIFQKSESSQTQTQKNMIGGGEERTTTFSLHEDWCTSPQPSCTNVAENGENSRGEWDTIVHASGGERYNGEEDPNLANMPPQLKAAMAKMGMATTNYGTAPHAQKHAPSARVGSFGLSQEIRREHPMVFASGIAPVPNEYLPDSVESCPTLVRGGDNCLRTFEENASPQNGDIKVVYEYVPDGFEASFIVEQVSTKAMGQSTPDLEKQQLLDEGGYGVQKKHAVDDRCFGKCSTDLGQLWMVRKGRHDVHDMIKMASEEEQKVTKLIRVLGWFLLMVGWTCLFAPFYTALEVLPLLGGLGFFAAVLFALIVSCLCCLTVTLLAYLRYRPLMVSAILLLVGGIWGIVAWRLNTAAETGGDPTGAPTLAPM